MPGFQFSHAWMKSSKRTDNNIYFLKISSGEVNKPVPVVEITIVNVVGPGEHFFLFEVNMDWFLVWLIDVYCSRLMLAIETSGCWYPDWNQSRSDALHPAVFYLILVYLEWIPGAATKWSYTVGTAGPNTWHLEHSSPWWSETPRCWLRSFRTGSPFWEKKIIS